MGRPAGQGKTPGSGRQKGTPNKDTADLREMILGALADAGGRQYLEQQAGKNPAAFLTLIGKVLPTKLEGAGTDGTIIVKIVKHTDVDTEPGKE